MNIFTQCVSYVPTGEGDSCYRLTLGSLFLLQLNVYKKYRAFQVGQYVSFADFLV